MTPKRWIFTACAVAGVVSGPPAWAADLRIHGPSGAYSVKVDSLAEARWKTVIRQRYDYSCGSAAVATLLTYHYERPITEETVFQEMFRAGNQQKIRAEGFSMLDMKRFLDRRGLSSDGFRMTLDKLAGLGVPGIALVNTKGYKHFVVVRGIEDDRVLVADPAAGSVAITREEFESIWNGIVLAARGNVQVAREHFNAFRDWRAWPRAPLGEQVTDSGLGTLTLTLPANLPGRFELGI